MTIIYYPKELSSFETAQKPYVQFQPHKYSYKVKKEKSKTDVNKKGQQDKEETFEVVEEAKVQIEDIFNFDTLDYIYLPIPNNLSDTISGALEEVGDLELAKETINAIKSFGNIEGITDIGGIGSSLKNLFFGPGSKFLKRKIGKTIMETLGLNNVSITSSGGLGIANPYDGMLYAGHERRNFSGMFSYNLQPENKEEEKDLNTIVNIFRTQSIGKYGDVITPPCSWDIRFYIGQFSFFVIENVILTRTEVNFSNGTDQRFMYSETGNPMLGFTLDFAELNRLNTSSEGLTIKYKK